MCNNVCHLLHEGKLVTTQTISLQREFHFQLTPIYLVFSERKEHNCLLLKKWLVILEILSIQVKFIASRIIHEVHY